jgi:pyruvate dehydrogenase (quinone)
LRQAFAAGRPVVLDVLSDPSVPPLPPHITLKQAKDFTSSILKGDVNAWDMIRETYKEVVENFLPHKS